MAQEPEPERTQPLIGDGAQTTSWEVARTRLQNPEQPRTCWLATTRPDGGPHLMPVIGIWIEGAMHVVAGAATRKARNIAADDRCVIATGSTTLPSLDIIIEGRAEAITDAETVRRVAEFLSQNNWPLEPKGDKVYGPHGAAAGPPPYTIYRIVPSTVFGLPGMTGMEQFALGDLPKPTRWEFDD